MLNLKLKCPHCFAFLMDEEKQLDGVPSIKMKIKFKDTEGTIWLSSAYGSNKFESDVEIPENQEVSFFCTECGKELVSESDCDECKAHLVPLLLEEGGRVRFCSRRGCVNHSLEFKRPETALKLLYETYASDRHPDGEHVHSHDRDTVMNEKERKEIIKNGTFLYAYCPHCKKALIKDNMIELDIINPENEEGTLSISPYLNVFQHKSTIRLSPEQAVKDIKCPHCHKSIIVTDTCPEDNFPAAKITVTSYSKMVDFLFCTKPGCKWHGLTKEDENIILLEDNKEW